MTRLIAIGDVHGCRDELELLLDRLSLASDDRLVFLGDLIDRGPYPLDVLRRVKQLTDEHPRSASLLGNHEYKWMRRLRRGRPLPNDDLQSATPEELDWLVQRPLFARERSRDLVFVHAGFATSYFRHYGSLPEDPEELESAPRKQRDRASRFVYIRHLTPGGDMVSLGQETAETPYWAEVYDGCEGFACFGHEIFMDDAPRRFPHALGLDGGCVFGGELLAAVWEGDVEPDRPRIVRQAALDVYAELRDLHGPLDGRGGRGP